MGRKGVATCVIAPGKVCALSDTSLEVKIWRWRLEHKLLYKKHLIEIARAGQNLTDPCSYPACSYCCEALAGIWIHHPTWIFGRRSREPEHEDISASSSAEYSGVARNGLSLPLGCAKTLFLSENKCWNTAFPGRLTWKHKETSSSTNNELPGSIRHTVTKHFIETTAGWAEQIPNRCWMTELTPLPNLWEPPWSKMFRCAGDGIHRNSLLLLKILLN